MLNKLSLAFTLAQIVGSKKGKEIYQKVSESDTVQSINRALIKKGIVGGTEVTTEEQALLYTYCRPFDGKTTTISFLLGSEDVVVSVDPDVSLDLYKALSSHSSRLTTTIKVKRIDGVVVGAELTQKAIMDIMNLASGV